jgi:hypothetical protein
LKNWKKQVNLEEKSKRISSFPVFDAFVFLESDKNYNFKRFFEKMNIFCISILSEIGDEKMRATSRLDIVHLKK